MKKERLALTTAADGSATVYSRPFSGRVVGIYVAVGDLENTVDITVTSGQEDAAIITLSNVSASAWYYPTVASCDQSGAARLYAAGGTAVAKEIPVDGAFKVVVAQGGNAKTGYVTFYVAEA